MTPSTTPTSSTTGSAATPPPDIKFIDKNFLNSREEKIAIALEVAKSTLYLVSAEPLGQDSFSASPADLGVVLSDVARKLDHVNDAVDELLKHVRSRLPRPLTPEQLEEMEAHQRYERTMDDLIQRGRARIAERKAKKEAKRQKRAGNDGHPDIGELLPA